MPVNRSILFVIGDLDSGGTERHLVQILPRLAEAQFRPMVYTLTHKGKLAPLLEQRGIPIATMPAGSWVRRLPGLLRKALTPPLSFLGLLGVLVRQRPRIVHVFLPAAYLLGGLTSLLAPCEVCVMSRRSLRNYQNNHPLLAHIERWLHRRMRAILGNSSAVVAQLRDEGVREDRLGLIYNGIDVGPYRRLPARQELRGALDIAEQTLVIVIVANLIPYKGHLDLIEALSRIRAELPQPWLGLLVGAGASHEAIIRRRAEDLELSENLRFLGSRDDVPRILGAADIAILCSHEEGFSNSILEGMAAALPLVVTDVGGNPEAVVDGQTGLVVPAKNPDALGAAILRLAKDEALLRRMGEAGRRRVDAQFSLDQCVARYCALYEGLLTQRQTAPVSSLIGSNLSR